MRLDRMRSIEPADEAPGACCDGLTALATRDSVARLLEMTKGEQLTVVAADLDGFRWVNDRLGDDVGDAVLCATARRLERLAGSYQGPPSPDRARVVTVARLGDDEFGVVLAGSPVSIAGFVDGVLGAFRSPMVIDIATITLTMSIGIATSAAPEGATGRQIVQWASRAAREAGRRGGDRAIVYSLTMSPGHRARLAAEQIMSER